MEALVPYLLKSSGILFLFYGCYQIFLRKETLFSCNRWFLLFGLLASMLLPFVYFTKSVVVNLATASSGNALVNDMTIPLEPTISWTGIVLIIYALGTLFFIFKLLYEIYSVRKFIHEGKKTSIANLTYVESSKQVQPFSFFSYVIYNPLKHTANDLELILAHEHVHAHQKHSLDILFMEVIIILQWFNPFAWLYKKVLKQNLEFLADTQNAALGTSKKQYQYVLLKNAIPKKHLSIINPFFNSLIKKRIVMINKSKSKRRNILKTALVLPALGIFLMSFNTKEVYVLNQGVDQTYTFEEEADKKIEIRIDKDTSDEELEKIKKNLAKKGFDFSYTVVHNEENEIISLSIDVKSMESKNQKMSGSSTFYNDGEPIDPVTLVMDDENTMFFMGDSDVEMMHEDDDHSVWIHNSDKKIKTVNISEENGKKIIRVNGKKISEEEYDELKEGDDFDSHHIKIEKSKKGENNSVMIIKNTEHDDEDIEWFGDDKNSFFFFQGEGDEDPTFYIDGKEATKEEFKALSKDEIEKVEVSKGKGATEKYGKKAKNGVVEITTKKN